MNAFGVGQMVGQFLITLLLGAPLIWAAGAKDGVGRSVGIVVGLLLLVLVIAGASFGGVLGIGTLVGLVLVVLWALRNKTRRTMKPTT